MILEFPVQLPRHAFSPRNAARAGDVWRAFQEVATEGSTRCGWSPDRYHEAGVGFIVREMTAVHHRETAHGEALSARTWVRDFRRGLLTTRECRILGEDGPIASASQEWVHVRFDHGAEAPLRPVRAQPELLAAFVPVDAEPSPTLPAWEPLADAPTHDLAFRAWFTWMDPLGHANHPAYVDWCDEATSVVLARAGIAPVALQPVAEQVRWKLGIVAPEEVSLSSRLVGRTAEGDAVIAHEMRNAAGALCATATTVRRLHGGGTDALFAALG